MAIKSTDTSFDVQILSDMIPGHFKGKNAFLGSRLQTGGAVVIDGTFPDQRVGMGTVTVPRFGTIGEFADNPQDPAGTFNAALTSAALKGTMEQATPARSSLLFEVTKWAQLSAGMGSDRDPYKEALRQIEVAVGREMDKICITRALTTELVRSVYSATTPVYLEWDTIVDGRGMWGDEQDDIVGMVIHSRVEGGLRKLRDANGRPLLVDNMRVDEVPTFCGIPLVVSNKVPLTGSSMGTVTETGAAVGGVGLTGTPTGAWDLRIRIIVGGARGTATFQFSTNGGGNWSATLTTAATVVLTDTATDSLVGNNGTTGLTATFGVATYDVLSTYSSTALVKATSLILQKSAVAFWYNAAAMALQTAHDISKDNDLAAMHLYYAAHRYIRRPQSSYTGVVAIQHNVQNYVG